MLILNQVRYNDDALFLPLGDIVFSLVFNCAYIPLFVSTPCSHMKKEIKLTETQAAYFSLARLAAF